MDGFWWVFPAVVLLVAFLVWTWFPMKAGLERVRFAEARRDFHRQRERLEAKFVQLGTVAERGDAPRWVDCEFEDDVAFARNRTTGELSAFVGVTIVMEDPGGHSVSIEDLAGRYRSATAVFRFNGRRWDTEGKAIFNLTPTEAIRFYHRELELVAQEAPGKL
jgi:hypothetical protein